MFNFLSFILWGQFLLPQRANNEKGGFIQLQMWMRQGVFCACGIQTGPFAVHWAHLVTENFNFFISFRGQFLLPKSANNGKGGFIQLQIEWDKEFSVPVAFKLGHIFCKYLFLNPVSQITFPRNFLILKIVIPLFPFPTSLSPLKSQFPREVWLSFPISHLPKKKREPNVNREKKYTKNVPLDHLHPIEPNLFRWFSIFSVSYWGADSYYPRGIAIAQFQKYTNQYFTLLNIIISSSSLERHVCP